MQHNINHFEEFCQTQKEHIALWDIMKFEGKAACLWNAHT